MNTKSGAKQIVVLSLLAVLIGPTKADIASGKVKDLDLDEQSIVMSATAGDIIVYMDQKTKIKKGAKPRQLKDIKVGGNVTVDFRIDGDDKIAASIAIGK